VELNAPRTSACVGVDILNSDGLGYELDDLYNAVDLVNFDGVNDLLTEELYHSGVELCEQLGVLRGDCLEGGGKEVDEAFGADVHNRHLHSLLALDLNGLYSADIVGVDVGVLEELGEIHSEIEPFLGVFSVDDVDLALPDGGGGGEVGSEGLDLLGESLIFGLESEGHIKFFSNK
jgi:hypothetical protein